MKRKKSDYIVQSVSKALDILEVLVFSDEELGATELSQTLQIQKTSTSRLLHTIEQRGYVEHNLETGNYRIGLKAFEMGQVYLHQLGLLQAAKPIITSVVEKCDESAYIATLRGNDEVYLDVIQTSKPLRLASRVGSIAPAYCTAAGKVQLAYLPPEDLEKRLSSTNFVSMTDETIVDVEELRKDLSLIADRGYAMDDQEFELGVRCIGVPIWDHTGQVIAGVSLSGPISRMTDERVGKELLPMMLEAGREISRRLGFDPSRKSLSGRS